MEEHIAAGHGVQSFLDLWLDIRPLGRAPSRNLREVKEICRYSRD
jgi:hypothetical protein